MIKRKLEKSIIHSLRHFPVVGIIGARQVGKTTLAKEIRKHFPESIYLDIELPSTLNLLQEPELYLSRYQSQLVILDEIQRLPELFPVMRSLVDQNRIPGRFLILGSSSPKLIKQTAESLAGRIIYHELTPLLIEEVGTDSDIINKLWLRGGFPESFLSQTDELSFQWRDSFVRTFLERDLPLMGLRVPPLRMHRFWTMLAHYQGQLFNASQLATAMDLSSPTIKNYLETLQQAFMVNLLPPFYKNLRKRLVKSPKFYFQDTGLLHALLNIHSFDDLLSQPALGHSFEGFVLQQIIHSLPGEFTPYFYRTAAGAEMDLVLVKGLDCRIGIEVKYSLTPKISKSLRNAMNDLQCSVYLIVYPGKEPYPLAKNVYAFPISRIPELFSGEIFPIK